MNFLKTSLALPPKKQGLRATEEDTPPSTTRYRNFTSHYQETEIDGERVGLTLWDSDGLDKGVIDLQMREISSFVESKFEDTFLEEMKVVRSPGAKDTHIHLVFFVLDPSRLDQNIRYAQEDLANATISSRLGKQFNITGAFDEDFELHVLRTLEGKTTVVPIVSKADTVTSTRMTLLKRKIGESFKQAGLDPMRALNFGEEDSESESEEEDEPIAELDDNPNDVRDEDSGESSSAPDTPVQPEATMQKSINHKREVSNSSAPYVAVDNGYVPLTLISPEEETLSGNGGPIGRKFPWGFADPYNPEHCEFVKIKDLCFHEWRAALREASREIFYERWRTNRLNRQTDAVAAAARAKTPVQRQASSGGIPIVLRPVKQASYSKRQNV